MLLSQTSAPVHLADFGVFHQALFAIPRANRFQEENNPARPFSIDSTATMFIFADKARSLSAGHCPQEVVANNKKHPGWVIQDVFQQRG